MITTEMEPGFAGSVRAELAAIGTKDSRLQLHQRRARAVASSVGTVVLVGALTGAAVVVNNLPGTTTVVPLGESIATSNTGTASIDIGPAPANATVVIIDITCISDSGRASVLTVQSADADGPGGSGVDCAMTDGMHVDDGLLPPGDTNAITITADAGTTWSATIQYGTSSTTEWGTNANGQTYGVPNLSGVPDLTPARASNGEWGYVFAAELQGMDEEGFINVYESDGTTIVGQQAFHIVENIPLDPRYIPQGETTMDGGE